MKPKDYAGLTENDRCPKCGTKTLEKDDEDLHCWGCGTIFYGALRKKPRTDGQQMSHEEKLKRHKYYEDNKQRILSDIESMGYAATCKKWSIPSGSFNALVSRWKREPKKPRASASPSTVTSTFLPPLPAFSVEWDPSVQAKWLEVYRDLVIGIKHE